MNIKVITDSDGAKWKGGQIDLIIDRSDNVMNLCEIKYSDEEYAIDKDYEETIKNNIHSGIVDSSITLEDMFL